MRKFCSPQVATCDIQVLMARALTDSEPKEQFGRFCLYELLHDGSISEIWLATDERERLVALRRLKREMRFNFSARRRFARSCEVMSQLNVSDQIVGYVEHGRDWLAMDYFEAENLEARIARQDVVLTENVAQILIDMALGLNHMHESGFLHLDFKPDNILVSQDGGVRLTDFDCARSFSDNPLKSAKPAGASAYLAPEQLTGGVVDARTDIFSYGVAAYELLANRRPFQGDTPEEMIAALDEPSSPVPLREHNPDTPAALEKIILNCLERDPERRYSFSGALVRDLQKVLYI